MGVIKIVNFYKRLAVNAENQIFVNFFELNRLAIDQLGTCLLYAIYKELHLAVGHSFDLDGAVRRYQVPLGLGKTSHLCIFER